jgi:hypothetical protein
MFSQSNIPSGFCLIQNDDQAHFLFFRLRLLGCNDKVAWINNPKAEKFKSNIIGFTEFKLTWVDGFQGFL